MPCGTPMRLSRRLVVTVVTMAPRAAARQRVNATCFYIDPANHLVFGVNHDDPTSAGIQCDPFGPVEPRLGGGAAVA